MALLPDLTAAALYALVVFLLFLGLLFVFVETIPPRLLMVIILAAILFAAWLGWVGEAGASILCLGLAAALLWNHAFYGFTPLLSVLIQPIYLRAGCWCLVRPLR